MIKTWFKSRVTVVTWFKSRVVLEVVCMTMRTILTPLPPWKSWKHKMGLKWFFENFCVPQAKFPLWGLKFGENMSFSQISLKLVENWVFLTTYTRKQINSFYFGAHWKSMLLGQKLNFETALGLKNLKKTPFFYSFM